MEIQSQAGAQTLSGDKAGNMKTGETVRLQVTERISDKEAMVKIRGNEVRAVFEGKIPSGEKINAEIKQITADGIRVQAIEEKHPREQKNEVSKGNGDARQVLKELGIKEPSRELQRAAQQLINRGIELNKESARDLNQYIEKGPGTPRERMQTVHMLAQKRIEPGAAQIKSVHETLHGPKMQDQMRQLNAHSTSESRFTQQETQQISAQHSGKKLGAGTPTELMRAVDQVRASLQDGKGLRQSIENLQQAAKNTGENVQVHNVNQLLRNMLTVQAQSGKTAAVSVLTEFLGSTGTQNIPGNTSAVQSTPAQWQHKLEQATDIRPVLKEITQQLHSSGFEKPVIKSLLQKIDSAQQLLTEGRELKARSTLIDAFKQLPQATAEITTQSPALKELEHFVRNEVLAPANVEAKAVLVTEITERLAKATDEFKAFQRDSRNHLHKIEQVIQQVKLQAAPIVKPMLENVIKQLDRAITKSDWLLYADMKQERKLLGASSQLAEAKNLLAKGQVQEAAQHVREVRQVLEQIQFKPSHQRLQHHVTDTMRFERMPTSGEQASKQFEHAARTLTYNDHSPRQIFEGMRTLGLNRETELSQTLIQGKTPTDQQQRDLKSVLLQMAKNTTEEGSRQAQQAVSHINGQQLLNRHDSTQLMHLFHLPVQLKEEVEELKIFVNDNNGGEEVDWENMNLYFHIETKKLGPLGISLNVANRQLSIVLKNDSHNFEEKVLPLTQKYMDNFEEIGFQVQKVKTQGLNSPENIKKESKPVSHPPIMTEKGFDYKV
ncbi:NfeD family protein [Alkalicoccus daliensis]|uniref:Hook-length control protein FliK n=1 Tax=Alkalicoccus daliensis TaxID=745820 RepID=A0A1H0B247_9BACI|nr:NfeD family protein [Alkalicoccus daliensis]SDN39734.1 hypothetical protein SAMN04488053_101722 [Alkalicoccus daliensis]